MIGAHGYDVTAADVLPANEGSAGSVVLLLSYQNYVNQSFHLGRTAFIGGGNPNNHPLIYSTKMVYSTKMWNFTRMGYYTKMLIFY